MLRGTTINRGTNKLYKNQQQLRYTLVLLTTTTKKETICNYTQRQLLATTKNPNYQELHIQATISHYKKRKHSTTTKKLQILVNTNDRTESRHRLHSSTG